MSRNRYGSVRAEPATTTSAGAAASAIGIARRERPARPIGGLGARARRLEVAGGSELSKEPLERHLGARGEAVPGDDLAHRGIPLELRGEAEFVDEAENEVDSEAVEVLRAQDELGREEGADGGIGDPREQRLEVFHASHHGADSTARSEFGGPSC